MDQSTESSSSPQPDAFRSWVQHHRPAFDTLAAPSAEVWSAIERQLGPSDAAPTLVELASPVPLRPNLTAHAGGAAARATTARPAWWQMAAAAVIVFGLGYTVRFSTEPASAPADTVAMAGAENSRPAAVDADADLHIVAPRHGFRNQEPDPAVQAAMLASNVQPEDAPLASQAADNGITEPAAIAPEISRLEARYAALVARQRAAARHRIVPTHTLADEWDRELAILDSTYLALRQELTRTARPDEVVSAMSRNLHLRLKLLHQQALALDAVQEARHRGGTAPFNRLPRRWPVVNPDLTPGAGLYDDIPGLTPTHPPGPAGGTLVPPAPPALEPLPGLGAGVAKRRLRLAV